MLKPKNKVISLLLSLLIIFSSSNFKVLAATDSATNTETGTISAVEDSEQAIFESKQTHSDTVDKEVDPNELVRIIVQVSKPTASDLTKSSNSNEISKVKAQVLKSQDTVKDQVKKIANTEVRNSFSYFINGFSATVKRSEIDKIKAIPGVERVQIANSYKLDMSTAVDMTQARQVWDELGYKGEGTVVSVIDSGIDVKHKDLKLTDIKKAKIKTPANSYATLKVPYVYNYADKNYDVVDKNAATDMHGMHVAGIVAANGDVKGVAPEAQVLSMKVFSNNPDNPSAFADDIVSAIEDSVTLGADVINMSLGSPSGFVDANDSEQVAIKKATEKGVMVVVSGGNSYYSTYPVKNANIPDTGLIGAPGIAMEALQVASYENTKVTGVSLDYKADNNVSGRMLYTKSEVKPDEALKDPQGYDIVDLGSIDNDDSNSAIYAKANGKIALIQKLDGAGKTSTYGQKKLNAQSAGAIGVIFYGVDDSLDNTAPRDGVTIPCICISKSNAIILKGLIGSNLKLSFNSVVISADNPNTGKMSDFSSWGPTPNLEFKPEITGVGGNIWSLANDNKYQSMSGTSMSSPHVAGAEALIVGSKKTQKISVPASEFINFEKNVSMNTSKILMDTANNVPISPRNQGAGLIQIKDAINDNVTVTYNGKAAAAIKEIGKEKTFELNVTNYGDKTATYTLQNGGVLTEIKSNTDKAGNVLSAVHDINIVGAQMGFSVPSVTVEPGKTVKVSVTITLPTGFDTEQFVEGYVKFKSETAGAPSLSIPYLGFYGDWSKPLVVDKPTWDPNHVADGSLLLGSNFFGDKWLGVARGSDDVGYTIPENVAISTVTDDYLRPVYAYLDIVRNAKEIKTEIIDSKGNVIRNLGVEYDVRKNTTKPSKSTGRGIYSSRWDVKVYNPTTHAYEYVKDGQYYYRIKAKADIENAKEQVFEMPIKVDSVAPKIEVISDNNIDTLKNGYILKWKASDDFSGLSREIFQNGRDTGAPMVKVNGTRISSLLNSNSLTMEGNGVFSYPVKGSQLRKGNNVITIDITDNAGNKTIGTFNLLVKDGAIPTNATRTTNCTDGFAYRGIVDGKYTVKGLIGDNVDTMTVNDVSATLDKSLGTFSATIPVTNEAVNVVKLVPKDKDGNVITDIFKNGIYNVTFDSVAPELKVDESNMIPCDLDGISEKIVTNKNTVTIKGTVNDKFLTDVRVNNTKIATANGDFTTDITVPNGPSVIDVTATDKAGNITTKSYFVVADIPDSALSYQFNIQSNMILTGKDVELKDGKYYLPVACKLSRSVKQIRIQDKVVPVTDLVAGSYVPIEDGIVKISVYIEDNDGTVAADYMYKIYFDSTAPEINLKSSYLENKDTNDKSDYLVKLSPDGTATVSGSVTDNAFGYTFFINGEQAASAQYMEVVGPDGTRRTFDKKVLAKVGDVIELKAVDLFGNETVKTVKVIKGDQLPIITVSGVEKDKAYNTDITPVIKAGEYTSFTATLDGEEYKGAPVTAEGAHKLIVNANNLAGNFSTFEINFTIDKTAPVITLTGVEDGKAYNTNIKPVFSANEGTVTATLNGKEYKGEEISAEGKYELILNAVDLAGNISTKKLSFNIDKTAPVITVAGVEEGKCYNNAAKVQISVDKGIFTAVLDGKEYKGEEILAAGEHTLVVDAKDALGNTSTKTVKFVVKAVISSEDKSTDTVEKTITNSSENNVDVSLANTSLVSKSIFEAISKLEDANKDKKVSFTVNTNNTTLTWTFKVDEIKNSNNIKDIDLSLNAQAPNKDIITKIDSNSQILSFKDNGVLPAPATIKVKLDSTKLDISKPVYFYYYNPTTKSTELISGPLTPDKDGYVEVTIKHCSDYFFTNNDNQKVSDAVAKLPKTGSVIDFNVILLIGSVLVGLGAVLVITRKRIRHQ